MKTPLKSKLVNYTNCLKISAQYLKYSAHQPLSKKSILRPFCPGLLYSIQISQKCFVAISSLDKGEGVCLMEEASEFFLSVFIF
jgi:hypothetical protein